MSKYVWVIVGIATLLIVLFSVLHSSPSKTTIDYDGMVKDMPSDPNAPPPISPGTLAPAFQVKLLNGGQLDSKALSGRPYIVDFWATWCNPCRMSIPGLEQLSKDYAPKGLKVVGISGDIQTARYVAPFVKEAGITYSVGLDPKHMPDIASAYNVAGFPSLYVVDKHGVVCWSLSGYYPGEEADLHRLLDRVLAES
jgi:thiol-disulfide isomerase/thioredoxin